MSRRAKLLITAGFLVPLLLLASYVALTWAPREPLHFRAVEVGDGSFDAPPGWRRLEYVVDNTSYGPIHLIDFEQGPRDGSFDPGMVDSIWSPSLVNDVRKPPRYIPARSTVRTWYLLHERDLKKDRGHYWMHHLWISRTRECCYICLHWLYKHSPEWLRPDVLLLDLHYDSTPITVAPDA